MSGRTSSTDRQGAARTGGLVLLVAAALGMTGLVAALATVGGGDDDSVSRSAARAAERPESPAADLVGAPDAAPAARVEAEDAADADAPVGEGRIAGHLAGPGWASGASIEVQLVGLTADGERVRRELSLDGLGAEWAFEGLPPGAYVARATASGGPRRAWGASAPIALDTGGAAGDVVVRMREYVLEGTVTTNDAAPLSGLPVLVDWHAQRGGDITSLDPDLRRALVSYSKDLQSAQDRGAQIAFDIGRIELAEEPVVESFETSGSDTVAARGRLRAQLDLRRAVLSQVEAAARAQVEQVSLQVTSFEAPEGRVYVSGVELRNGLSYGGPSADQGLEDEEIHRQLSTETDALGRFKLWLPGPGRGALRTPEGDALESSERWRWYRKSGAPFAVSTEEPRASVEVDLVHVGAISGVVTAPPREGDQDLEVFVRPLEGERASTQHTTAREGGRYSFANLRPGRYVLYGRSGGSAGQDVSHRAVVRVYGGAEARADLPLATSSSVVGSLVDAGGAPIANAGITAYGEDNDNLTRNGRTDENGRFTIVGMYGGPYVIKADGRALVAEPRLRLPQGGAVVDAGMLRVGDPIDAADVAGAADAPR